MSLPLPLPLGLAIEQGIETVLKLDPESRERLTSLDGKLIEVCVSRPAFSIMLSVVDQHVYVVGGVTDEPDARITGSLAALRSLSSGNDALYRGEVVVSGDVGVGQRIKEILAAVDPDWEELISPFLGDTVAHKLGNLSKYLSSWLSRTQHSFKENSSDYLQEEALLLAPDLAVLAFCTDVDETRAATDRLEARISQLEQARSDDKPGPRSC